MMKFFKTRSQRGASGAEYCILAGCVALCAIGTISGMGHQLKENISASGAQIAQVITENDPTVPEFTGPRNPYPKALESGPGNFLFPTLTLDYFDPQTRVTSNYVTLTGLGETPAAFSVTSQDGSAVAAENVIEADKAQTGTLTWGTRLEASAPETGEAHTVTLDVNGVTGTWRVEREGLPDFTFMDTYLSWDEDPALTEITSNAVNITGLDATPRPFTLTSSDNSGNPTALTNVQTIDGVTHMTHGTQLQMDMIEPGETRVLSLDVGGGTGTWRVERTAPPVFRISGKNNTFAYISFAGEKIPQRPYPFELSGTGNTNPKVENGVTSGTPQKGMTKEWGINISNDKPAPGKTETITLIILGQTLTWTVKG